MDFNLSKDCVTIYESTNKLFDIEFYHRSYKKYGKNIERKRNKQKIINLHLDFDILSVSLLPEEPENHNQISYRYEDNNSERSIRQGKQDSHQITINYS